MVLPFQDEKLNSLFSVVQKLGERSNRSYAIVNRKNEILYFNEMLVQLTGFSHEYLQNTHYLRLVEKTQARKYLKEIEQRLLQGKVTRTKFVHKRKTGSSFYAEIECIPFTNELNETELVLLFVRDITYRQLYDFMARIEQDMYSAIQEGRTFIEKLEIICDGIDTMFYQKSLTSIVIQEDGLLSIVHSNSYKGNQGTVKLENQKEIVFYNNLMNGGEILVYDYIGSLPLYRPQKELAFDMHLSCIALIPILLQDGSSIGLISIIFDEQYINENEYYQFFEKLVHLIALANAYELKQREIFELAYFDKYISIPNRHGFINKVHERERTDRNNFVQIIEPGNFTRIVELYGRDAGDELLKQIYERFMDKLQDIVPLVGRLSSSSIIVYVEGDKYNSEIMEEVVKSLVKQPFTIEGKRIYVTLKSGVTYTSRYSQLEDSIRQAERALTEAKRYAGTYTSFYVRLNDKALEREVEILNQLIDAIKSKSFVAYFQPKIELHRGRIASMEALSRWYSPSLGQVSPMEFIPIAERAGIVHEIDLQIIEQVLQWFQRRQYEGKRIVPIAVNISPEHFYHPQFVKDLIELVQAYYADPNYLIIEITESIGLVDIELASNILHQLNIHGFRTSIDDFGMGYSSLSYLQKLKFTELKIDRSFTQKIHEVGTHTIVKSIVEIANAHEISVVAEGVETSEQQGILRALGCYSVQGYYHYKPISIQEVEDKGILD